MFFKSNLYHVQFSLLKGLTTLSCRFMKLGYRLNFQKIHWKIEIHISQSICHSLLNWNIVFPFIAQFPFNWVWLKYFLDISKSSFYPCIDKKNCLQLNWVWIRSFLNTSKQKSITSLHLCIQGRSIQEGFQSLERREVLKEGNVICVTDKLGSILYQLSADY